MLFSSLLLPNFVMLHISWVLHSIEDADLILSDAGLVDGEDLVLQILQHLVLASTSRLTAYCSSVHLLENC